MRQMMMRLALAIAALSIAALDAQAIDWGSAGAGDTHSTDGFKPRSTLPPQEAAKPDLPDSGFVCDTVTRMSWERPSAERDRKTGPDQVRRCSRDGMSFEVTPPT